MLGGTVWGVKSGKTEEERILRSGAGVSRSRKTAVGFVSFVPGNNCVDWEHCRMITQVN